MKIFFNQHLIPLKKIFFLILFFQFVALHGVIAKTKIDSLRHQIAITQTDSLKAQLLNKLATELIENHASSIDTIRMYLNQSIGVSEKINFTKEIAASNYLKGKSELAITLNYSQATTFLLQSLSYYEKINDSAGIAKCYLQLGLVSYILQYNEDAIKNFEQSLHFSVTNMKMQSTNYYLIALSYSELKKHIEALSFFKKALKLNELQHYYKGISECYTYMGKMYTHSGNYDSAFIYFNSALENIEIYEREENDNDNQGRARVWGFESETYLRLNNLKEAIATGIMGFDTAYKYNDEISIMAAANTLHKAFALTGDYKNAFFYLNSLKILSDSIYNSNSAQRVAELKSKFEFVKEKEIAQKEIEKQKVIRNSGFALSALAILFLLVVFFQYRRISTARRRSDELLLNILPKETAEELKENDFVQPRHYESVSVLFTDIKDFSLISTALSPVQLVEEINLCYKAFDEIITRHGIEKIKTIGDAYMCAGGVPQVNDTHAVDIVRAGLEMQQFMIALAEKRKAENKPHFEMRCGIHTGPVVAGVVGTKKFAYDIWGDTVNIADRIEENGETGRVNISGATYELVKIYFNCTHRGKIMAKNQGEVDMYFVEAK